MMEDFVLVSIDDFSLTKGFNGSQKFSDYFTVYLIFKVHF